MTGEQHHSDPTALRRTLLAGAGGASLLAALRPAAAAPAVGGRTAADYGIRDDGSDVSGALGRLFARLEPGATIVFDRGTYGIAEPVVIPPRIGESAGFRLTGARGARFVPLAPMPAMFVLSGDQIDIAGLSFANAQGRAAAAFKIAGSGTNNLRVLFSNNLFSRFQWAIDSAAADRIDTIENTAIACAAGFARFASNGMNSTHFGNYVLGGRHGFLFTHAAGRAGPQHQQAEGVRILSNTLLCTAPGAQAVALNGGLEIHLDNNIIDQTGANGVGVALEADRGRPVWGVKLGSNWVAGGARGAAIRARGPVSHLFVGATTLVGKTRDNRTIGLDLAGVRALRVDGAVTLALTGPAARFADCDGEIRSTDLRAGAGVAEDSRSSLLWIGNRALPPRAARSPGSRFFANLVAGGD
jgi:hypothetical protein